MRRLALQQMFQGEFISNTSSKIPLSENFSFSQTVVQKAQALVWGCLSQKTEIDAKIAQASQHWALYRISLVDKNILRIAIFEILFTVLENRVVLNEAIEIAKIYSTNEAVSFINGVLNAIIAAPSVEPITPPPLASPPPHSSQPFISSSNVAF